jgi:hypothetical protein
MSMNTAPQKCSIMNILKVLHGVASLLTVITGCRRLKSAAPNKHHAGRCFFALHNMATLPWGTQITDVKIKGAVMNSDTEKFRSKQEQGTRNSTGSVDTSDSKGNSLPTKESQNNPPHDISKKNPPQGTDSQHQGQQKTEGEKRRTS